MADPRISFRYARALFDLALPESQLQAVHQDLEGLMALRSRSAEFADLLDNPSLPQAKVQQTLSALLSGQVSPLTLRFLLFLADRRRLAELPGIAKRFESLHDQHLNQLKVQVTSAREMTAAQREELSARLQKRLGKKVIAQFRTNPALVGGFQFRVGDEIHDYSIATMLESFKHQLITV